MIDPRDPRYQQNTHYAHPPYSPPQHYSPPNGETFMPDAPTEAYFPQLPPQAGPLPGNVRPEHLIRRNQQAPQGPVHKKLAYLWRTDPAYRVLYISLAVVVVAFLIFFAVVGGIFAHGNPSTHTQQQATTNGQQPKQNNPQTGGNQKPTAQPTVQPTPTQMLAPTPTPIPAPTPTPIPQPTPTTVPVQLTAQITNVPNVVQNNSTVQVTVQTSHPNANVALFVVYEGIPTNTTSGPQQADANGVATINWNVHERRINRAIPMIIARMVAEVKDQNGQQAQSQTVTVQIQAGPGR